MIPKKSNQKESFVIEDSDMDENDDMDEENIVILIPSEKEK